jgi:UDP-N-acetylmuramoylalanine--D-glutamate ligase
MLAAVLSAKLLEPGLSVTKKDLLALKTVTFRQEVIATQKGQQIVNDTAATSPDATVAALERFSGGTRDTILITGGTDKKLDYTDLAGKIKKHVRKKNLILLEGSGTKKLVQELKKVSFSQNEIHVYETLEECVREATSIMKEREKGALLFSPAAASFEKFVNEVERGKHFNELIQKTKW